MVSSSREEASEVPAGEGIRADETNHDHGPDAEWVLESPIDARAELAAALRASNATATLLRNLSVSVQAVLFAVTKMTGLLSELSARTSADVRSVAETVRLNFTGVVEDLAAVRKALHVLEERSKPIDDASDQTVDAAGGAPGPLRKGSRGQNGQPCATTTDVARTTHETDELPQTLGEALVAAFIQCVPNAPQAMNKADQQSLSAAYDIVLRRSDGC